MVYYNGFTLSIDITIFELSLLIIQPLNPKIIHAYIYIYIYIY